MATHHLGTDSIGYHPSPGYHIQPHSHASYNGAYYPQRQSATAFRKNLKKIDDGLGSQDVEKLCFLCRDFDDTLAWKDLQDFKRGIELFTALEKADLLSIDDVSLLFELLESIQRRDLLKKAGEIWPTTSNQIHSITPYRKLLLDIANNTTSSELMDLKALACLPYSAEHITNPIQFMIAMENAGMMSRDNMRELVDILSNKMNIRKVEKYIASTSQQPSVPSSDHLDSSQLIPPAYFSLPATPHGPSRQASSSDDVVGIEKTMGDLSVSDKDETKQRDEHQNHDENLTVASEKQHLQSNILAVGGKKFDAGVNRQQSTFDSTNSVVSMTVDEHSQLVHTGGENLPVVSHGMHQSRPDTCSNISGTAQIIEQEVVPIQRSLERCYRMTTKPTGFCLIINNDKFSAAEGTKKLKDRVGSEKDVEKLLNCFTKFNFQIIKRDNIPTEEMYKQFNQVINSPDLKHHEAFLCCILTHGKMGQLAGSNSKYIKIREIISVFTAEKCPHLAGKPKMFFLQACQGRDEQGLHDIEKDCPRPTKDHGIGFGLQETIPNEADFLLGYATVPGYVSYRSRTTGSWYIPALVDALNDNYREDDIMSILTIVNQKLSRAKANKNNGEIMGQVPAPVMSLRKKVYFHREEIVQYL